MNRHELSKAIWKQGRGGKFEQLSKMCTCACKKGIFCPLESARGRDSLVYRVAP